MKKFCIFSIIILLVLQSCVKEVKPTDFAADEIKSGKPPADPGSAVFQWQKCYGSSAMESGNAIAVNSTNDGYFVAGVTEGNNGDVLANHGGQDAWVIKISLTGQIIKRIAIGGSGADQANAVVATGDGGCLVVGATESQDGDGEGNHGGADLLLVKLSGDLEVQWKKTIGGSGYDKGFALITTTDNGYAIAGQTGSNDGDLLGVTNAGVNSNGKQWLIKLDQFGNIEWQNVFIVSGAKDDVGYALTQTADGGYSVTGRTLNNANNADISVVHTGNDGTVMWSRTIDGAASAGDVGFGITTSNSDTGSVVVGYINVNTAVAIKLKKDGKTAWQTAIQGGPGTMGQGRSIIPVDMGYIVTGFTNSKNGDIIATKGGIDMFVLKLTESGAKIVANVLGGKSDDKGLNIVKTID
ncbi:MAG TPA: hypothetical protein VLC28_12535, partial [Flavitalea sp.]|nr:hypothetical protein [Flavitalea sp.]